MESLKKNCVFNVFILPHNSSISTYEKITVWLGPHETVNKHTCTEILLL